MKKIAILGFLMFFLATSLVSALIIKPEISLITPKTTDVLNGVVTLKAELIYGENTTNTTLAKPTQMLFEYSSMQRKDCYSNTKCIHGKLPPDKKGSDGWSASWNTKNISDGEYYINVYAFGGDNAQFLITNKEFGPFQVNKSAEAYVDINTTTINQTVNQTINLTTNTTTNLTAINQTTNQTPNQNNITQNETTISINMSNKPKEELGFFAKIFRNLGLLLKAIFIK